MCVLFTERRFKVCDMLCAISDYHGFDGRYLFTLCVFSVHGEVAKRWLCIPYSRDGGEGATETGRTATDSRGKIVLPAAGRDGEGRGECK